jgi:hypothetical protein
VTTFPDLRVTSEGVEDAEALAYLREIAARAPIEPTQRSRSGAPAAARSR